MSDVPLLDAKTSLKKMISIIADISGLNTEFIPKIRSQPEMILGSIDKYEGVKGDLITKINTNIEQINTLKNKILQNQRDIIKLSEDNKQLSNQQQELMDKLRNKQNEIQQIHETIKMISNEFEEKKIRLKELEDTILDLTRNIEKFETKLKALETELENTFIKKEKFVQNYENRVAAMKILINKKYISSSLIQFFRALQVGSTLDLKNILLAIDMRDDQAKRIINKILEENGPIEYDNSNGTITLKEEVDFK
jgi:chromosome segregation ATPase